MYVSSYTNKICLYQRWVGILYNKQSSAKSLTLQFTCSGKSFINNKNKVGPKTVPFLSYSSFLLVLYMYITTGKYSETSACEIVNYKSVHMGLDPSQLI
jgi:hypothetical protein